MYAVIETGGKQYRVEVGTVLEVEKLEVDPGTTLDLQRVLLVADGDEAAIGHPLVEGAAVSAEVLRQDRAKKVINFKYRPKARRRVKKGHRQDITILRISDIVLNGKSAAASVVDEREARKTERERLEEAAARQAALDAALAEKLAEKAASDAAATEEATAPAAKPARGRSKAAAEAKAAAAAAEAEQAAETEAAAEVEASDETAGEPAAAPEAAVDEAEPEPAAAPEAAPEPPAKPRRRTTKKDG
jgi:large subunit ribosomal protein L21